MRDDTCWFALYVRMKGGIFAIMYGFYFILIMSSVCTELWLSEAMCHQHFLALRVDQNPLSLQLFHDAYIIITYPIL